MKSLIVLSGIIVSNWAAPQVTFGANDKPKTSCGLVNNVQRNVGDTWTDDCNNCVCRETGIATCTRRFCGNIPVIRNPNEAVASCGIVNGEERKVGDSWTDDCNNCVCRESGDATCTQRFCGGGDRPGINFAAVCKNAINGEDRLEGETWIAADGCNNCVCRAKGIATCTKKLCLNAPVISPPRDIPCLGCPQESDVDEDITAAAVHATASLSGISDSGCGGIKLVKVENAKKQVVAGTNFVLTLRLETREGQGCANKTEKICENIVVFKPLPFACQSDDGCLELMRQTDISCKPAPAVCKNAINGEDRLEGETWIAADGCNNCVCRETGIATCTKKFCLNSPVISAPRDNSLSCPGCAQESVIDEEIFSAAVHATASLSGISDSGCGGIKLVKVESAKKQVVAGTNFVLTLRLETREGQGCADKTEKICENIVVFKPLPFACQSDDGCLELMRQTNISCKPAPAVCKNAINGEDRQVGKTWIAADGCNNCLCMETGIATCTKKLCLNAPVISPPRDNNLSCPGCAQESVVIDREIKLAAVHATASLSGISDSGCGGIKLVKVENAKKQVVAGTNFVLTLRLETREGQGCANKTEKICENIVVFKPLTFACQSDDGCLELTTQTDISCKPAKPAVCKNAINGEDRLVGENWIAADGCNNCLCMETGIATCTKKLCLNAPVISRPRDNSLSCPGCAQESVVIDREIKLAAVHATASLSGISDSGCGGVKLVKVENAKKQVVAGTNFFLTLRLETREGQGCADKTEKICENIVVFKPLPFACQSDDGCLELARQTDLSCKPANPAVCKNAINGEDRLEGENWTAADGCNNCRCLKSGIPGCTKKFCLDKPLITTSRPVRDNSLSCPGCPIESVIDEEIFSAAVHATASLAGINTVSGCGGISLVNVENARKQIVAGTNFFLTLRLQTRGGQGCADKIEKICENIVVFKPLPFRCQSQDGCLELTRQPGISCQEVQSSRDQLQSASSVLSLSKGGVQTSSISQCQGEGKENCQTVNINNSVLDNLNVGDKVALLPGLDVDLTLKQPPTQGSSSTSFVFAVGQFGEAILTRGNNRSSMFGSIKPGSGNVDYSIENCGDGCNVIYQRDSGFFNQFKD